MKRTREEIKIPKGTEVKEESLGWCSTTVSDRTVYIHKDLVYEPSPVAKYTEPGWNAMSSLKECENVLILSGETHMPYIGLKNLDGEIVLRDHASAVPDPVGWREIDL